MIKQILSEAKAELKPSKLIVTVALIIVVPMVYNWVMSKIKPPAAS
ncbi:MAG: hypothetical protein PHP10_03640 [Candidatus Omnitrophica bacterium]|nr:hypothetical protein [Candidatus Omnitrophota bacterium]